MQALAKTGAAEAVLRRGALPETETFDLRQTMRDGVACPPCPDFAAKGTKLGTRTDRGKLIYAPLNYAKVKRPLAVCLENVHTLKTLFPEVYNELTKDPVYEQCWSC